MQRVGIPKRIKKRKVLQYFQGDIQELKFYSTPDAAYEMCSSVLADICVETQNKTETSKTDVNEIEEPPSRENWLEITNDVRISIQKQLCDIIIIILYL